MLNSINYSIDFIKKTLFSKDYNARFQNILEVVGKVLFLLIVFTVCAFQVSTFIDFNLNKLNYFLILLLFIVFLFLNYKETLLTLTRALAICSPLLLLCVISKFINHSVFLPEMVVMTLTSFIMLSIAFLSRKLFYKNDFKFFCSAYLIGCIFFIVFAFIFDWKILFAFENTYSYFSKNSAAPMLCCGLIFIPYLFSDRSIKTVFFKLFLYCLFLLMIVLLRCRSAILCLPIIFLYNIYKRDHNSKEKWIWISLLIVTIIIVFTIPQLRKLVVDSFIQSASGGTSIDDISSGRFTQLFNVFKDFSPLNILIGRGTGYVDIMPAFILCYFGIIGLVYYIALISFLIYITIKTKKSIAKDILIILLIFYLINSLFEAYGLFGPGAKVFALWGFIGFTMNIDIKQLKLIRCIGLSSADSSVKKGINKLKFKQVSLIVLSLFTAVFLISSLIPNASSTVGSSIYSLLPRDGRRYETVSADSVEIDIEKTGTYKNIEMFVGEKRTLTATVFPAETLDKKLYWNTYQPDIININHETGEITALKSGYASVVCHVNDKRNIIDESLRVLVKNENGIASSIELAAITETSVSKNESIVFETSIFPNYLNSSLVALKCSEPSFVIINEEVKSIVPIVNNVSFDVWGEYLNSDNTITTSNRIKINVDNETLNKCAFIELPDIEENLYEKETIKLKPIVTLDSDDKFKIIYNSSDIALKSNDEIEFLKEGQTSITLISTFDPSIRCTRGLSIQKNNLIKINCSNDWSIVGKLNKINVEFIYESGLIRIPEANEFKMTVSGDKYAAAVSDSYEYFAKVVGTFSGRIISNANQDIYSWYEITNHSITKAQYTSILHALSCIFELLLLINISILLVLFVRFKNYKRQLIIRLSFVGVLIISSIISFILIIKSPVSLVLSIILLLGAGISSIFVKLKAFNYECDYIELVNHAVEQNNSFYELII